MAIIVGILIGIIAILVITIIFIIHNQSSSTPITHKYTCKDSACILDDNCTTNCFTDDKTCNNTCNIIPPITHHKYTCKDSACVLDDNCTTHCHSEPTCDNTCHPIPPPVTHHKYTCKDSACVLDDNCATNCYIDDQTCNNTCTTPSPILSLTYPLKVIYIDEIKWDNNGIIKTIKSLVDSGYNVIILAFFITNNTNNKYLCASKTDYKYAAYDASCAWQQLTPSDRKMLLQYAHDHKAIIMVSAGGATDNPIHTFPSGEDYGNIISTWANANELDGVDFDIESIPNTNINNAIKWLADASNKSRSILGPNKFISHAPQSPYFGNMYNQLYIKVYKAAPTIDFFNIQFYNQNVCCYNKKDNPNSNCSDIIDEYDTIFIGKNINRNCANSNDTVSIKTIIDAGIPANKLIVGKPMIGCTISNVFCGIGYLDPATLRTYIERAKHDIGWNTGIMTWEYPPPRFYANNDDKSNAVAKTFIQTIYPQLSA